MDGPSRARAPDSACSCELLRELVSHPEIAALVAPLVGGPQDLIGRAEDPDHDSALQGLQWGRSRRDLPKREALQVLLALLRDPTCHGYRLLSARGLSCPDLRRHIVRAQTAPPTAEPPPSRVLTASTSPRPARTSLRRATSSAPAAAESHCGSRVAAPALSPSPSPRRRSPNRSPEHPTADAIGEGPTIPRPQPSAIESSLDEMPTPDEATWSPTPIDPARLAPLLARDRELARLCDGISRSCSRPLILVGAPGTGRTLLASHLAVHIAAPVFHTSALALPSDENDLRSTLASLANQQSLLVIDDIDTAMGETTPPWFNVLMGAWLRGQPRCVLIATPVALLRLTALWPGLREGADIVAVDPMGVSEAVEVLTLAMPALVRTSGCHLAADLKPRELVWLADHYLAGLAMPGRALDLLDLSCARARRMGTGEVTRTLVHELVAELSGLPASRIGHQRDQDVLDLEPRLAQTVVGHREAIARIAQLVRRNRAGMGGTRPVLSALLLGPSGVGKTELAKALAKALFEREDALIRLDMSEYAESHAVARIVGAPPGYVGYEQGGALTDPLLQRPHAVVLLDEIEKAHRDVHQLLLQVLDEGRLTDGRGRTVSFRHAAILMTSNLGAHRIAVDQGHPTLDEGVVLADARAAFPVELWNRIEAPVVMQPLTTDELIRVCRKLTGGASDQLHRERGVAFDLDLAAYRWLVEQAGLDPALGARPLRHLVTRHVEGMIADALLRGEIRAGTRLVIGRDARGLTVRKVLRGRHATKADPSFDAELG